LGNRSFAMRIWLNPERMRAYNISVEDVMKAEGEQSIIGSPGRLGQATGMTSQSKEYCLTYIGRFNKPEQYGNIILRANPNGEILRLKDICVPPKEQPEYARSEHADGGGHAPEAPSHLEAGHGEKAKAKRQHAGIELGSELFATHYATTRPNTRRT